MKAFKYDVRKYYLGWSILTPARWCQYLCIKHTSIRSWGLWLRSINICSESVFPPSSIPILVRISKIKSSHIAKGVQKDDNQRQILIYTYLQLAMRTDDPLLETYFQRQGDSTRDEVHKKEILDHKLRNKTVLEMCEKKTYNRERKEQYHLK